MEIIQPIADLFGISPGLLIALTILGVLLVVGWYILKFAFKMAWKTFSAGCVLIALLVGGVFMGSFLLSLLR
jgi:hypothetical protein